MPGHDLIGQPHNLVRHPDLPAKATPVLEGGRVQVNGSVAEIDSLTQQNAAMVEQLAATASSLNGQAAMGWESMRIFRG